MAREMRNAKAIAALNRVTKRVVNNAHLRVDCTVTSSRVEFNTDPASEPGLYIYGRDKILHLFICTGVNLESSERPGCLVVSRSQFTIM